MDESRALPPGSVGVRALTEGSTEMNRTLLVAIAVPTVVIIVAAVAAVGVNDPPRGRNSVTRVTEDDHADARVDVADVAKTTPGARAVRSGVEAASDSVESPAGGGGHGFPIFGDVDVLPRVSISELDGARVDYEAGRQACRKLRALAREHSQRALEESPWLLSTALDIESAGEYCAGGGVLLIGVDPESPRGLNYIPCPPEYADAIHELQEAYTIIAASPDYLSGVAQRLGAASPSLGDSASGRMVAGPTLGSYRVLGEDGSVLVATYDNVPGVMHPSR